jgi:hypothetical protein
MSARLDAARGYVGRNWCPIPVRHREKRPGFDGWEQFTATPENLPRRFGGAGNIGVILGTRSGGLGDVDLDCPEAVELADIYLPRTGAVFGRASKPRSHRVYVAPGAVFEKFSDPLAKGACLLELRSDTAAGGREQTVFPPSVHETGEQIRWEGDTIEPRVIDAVLLRRACAWLAVGCMVARYVDPELGTDWARHPSLALPRQIWAGFPAVAGPIYRWLDLYNPDDQPELQHVPEDIDLAGLVAMIPNDFDREGWVKVGLAIYAASGGKGEEIWLAFSRQSPRYNKRGRRADRADAEAERVWRSFIKARPRAIGAGYLFKLASGAGP